MEFSLINLLLVLLLAWLGGGLANRLGYPAILGELTVGILFGPAILGWLHGSEGLHVLAEVGVFLLLLYIGMEVNYRDLLQTSKSGLAAAIGGFLIPLFLVYVVLSGTGIPAMASLVVGLTLGVTSLAVLSRILVDLKLLGTRVANVMITGAVICDTGGLILFGAILSLGGTGEPEFGKISVSLLKALVFFGVTMYIGLKVFPLLGKILKHTGFTERTANFTLLMVVGLVFAGLAELCALHSILGAFLAGMFMRGEVLMRKVSHEMTTLVRDLSLGFLTPIFFVSAAFHVELGTLFTEWKLFLLILALGSAGKILGTALCYLPSRTGWREALTIGVGMNGHGAVEIIIAEIAHQAGLIDNKLFSIIVFVAFVTTVVVPVFLKVFVRWLKARDELARANEQRTGILIVGATPLARKLAGVLKNNERVCLIDNNSHRCKAASSEGLEVHHGNAMSEEALDLIGAGNARALVAMTANAEVNGQVLKMAQDLFHIPDLFEAPVEIDPDEAKPVITERDEMILKLYPESYNLEEWDEAVTHDDPREVEHEVTEEAPIMDQLEALRKKGMIPLALKRGEKILIPAAVDTVQPGDMLVGLQRPQEVVPPEYDVFDSLVRNSPILDLEDSVDVETLFREVSKIFSKRLSINEQKIFKALKARELESTTVLVPGVAIPHIMFNQAIDFSMVIARCKEGVTFFDQETEARIIFVIAGPISDRNTHLRLLSAIAQLFQEEAFEDTLLSVEGTEAIRDVILTTERRRF